MNFSKLMVGLVCGFWAFQGFSAEAPRARPAPNPISPLGTYLADPEARVWADGRLYVYGSRDENPGYWCSKRYHMLSTDDLSTWTLHRDIFASSGYNDEVPHSDQWLYAPDAMYRDGKYYLYYCLAGGGNDEGVAVSDSPTGPFRGGQVIAGARGIDPAVLVDDDGSAYLYWGQLRASVARLKPNMVEIDQSTVKTGILDSTHAFHEGQSIRKINGLYYNVYAYEGRNKRPTALAYATSESPTGPFTFRGVIIDNIGSDSAVWNNHGSIQQFRGRWYVFYHRSTHGSQKMRQMCMEPIEILPDGSIPEVEMTTQGAGGPLPAEAVLEAARACQVSGGARVLNAGADFDSLGGLKTGASATYKYLDFSARPELFSARIRGATKGGRIEVRLDGSEGPVVATCEIPATEDKGARIVSAVVDGAEGAKRALVLRFYGELGADLRLEHIAFGKLP